jgi:restriction endonuclease S subunit
MPKNTNTTYKCEICDEEHSKKSVNDCHLKSEKHLKNCEIFRLKLNTKEMEDILIDYPEYENKFENKIDLIEHIIKYKSSVKIEVEKVEEVNTMECQKYKPSNEVVWELSENDTDNIKYKEQFSKLQKVIDNVHQYMFNNNQINGITAMRDMMKILPIIILKDYFTSEEFSKEIDKLDLSQKNKELYKKFVLDIKTISKEDNPLNKFKLFIQNCISKILPDIFKEGDGTFEFNKSGKGDKTFIYMIQEFSNITVDKDFKDGFACSCGDIHELFRKYAGKKEAKDFGGFNTPRHALNMIYDFDSIKQLINERMSDDTSIFDPTMGTAGFLTRFFNLFTMNAENIYGCELSPDTIKFAFVSLYLTSGKILKNLESCNSLSESDNIFKKHIIGLANPPFGTSIKYKEYTTGKGASKQKFDGEIETFIKFHMKDKYDTEEDKKEDEEKYKNLFKEIYTIETNNGACLFTQHFVYKLEDNGLGIIILPDGEIFDGNSKWSKTFRKWLLTNVNLKMIIKMPSGTFEHAGVKTNVLVFTKNGKTENIQYLDTTKECNVVKELFTITEEDLKSTNYSLDMSAYLVEEETNFEVPIIKLKDMYTHSNGGEVINKTYWNKGDKILYTCKKTSMLSDYPNFPIDKLTNDNDLLISRNGTPYIHIVKENCIYSNVVQRLKIKNEYNVKYIYYYIKTILNKMTGKGQTIPSFNMDIWNNIDIPLPSLEIQEKIVEELSMIETNITSIETRIKQLKDEKEIFKKYSRKSEIKELLKGAEIKKLDDVCEINGGTRIVKKNNTEGQYPVYGSGNESFTTTTFNREGLSIIVGRFALSTTCVRLINKQLYLNDSGLTIHHDNEQYQLFIGYYLLNNQYDIYNMSRGQAQRNLDMEKFKVMKIPVPSPEIQEQCIQIYQEKESFINSIDDKIDSEKNYINELKNLTKDIIHSYC